METNLKVSVTKDSAQGAPIVTPTPLAAKTAYDFFASPAPPPREHVPRTPAPLFKYEEGLNLSPTNMLDEQETQRRIEHDLILDESFYHQATPDAQDEIVRCLYFLYGRKFYWEHRDDDKNKKSVEPAVRVGLIKDMVANDKSRERLLKVVECYGDKDMTGEDGIQTKFTAFAKSFLRLIEYSLKQGNAAGFKANMTDIILFLRYQTFGTCYLVAACTAYGYQMQKDLPDRTCGTPDAAQLARRIMTDLNLYDLVTERQGGTAVDVMSRLLGRDDRGACESIWFGSQTLILPQHIDMAAVKGLKEWWVGLVDGFALSENFHKRHQEAEEWWEKNGEIKPGVWVFDGDKDSEGRFLSLSQEVDNEDDTILKMWKNHDNNKKDTVPLSASSPFTHQDVHPDTHTLPDVDHTSELPPAPAPAREQESVEYHSMILLHSYEEEGKIYFLLQNSWEYLPLVLVTGEYLNACKAAVSFFKDALGSSNVGLRTDLSVTSCSLPKSSGMPLPVYQHSPEPGF